MGLPAAPESEAQVVGAVLAQPNLIPALTDVLRVEDFTSTMYRTIFSTAVEMAGDGLEVDVVSVARKVRGGIDPVKVANLAADVTTTSSALYHARLVRDVARTRALALLGTEVAEAAMKLDAQADTVLEQAEAGLYRIATDHREEDRSSWADAVTGALTRIEHQYQTGKTLVGIPTGLETIDGALGGLQRGWLTYVGARPGVGKTALAMQAAIHAARCGFEVMVCSLEMSAEQIATRALCNIAAVDFSRVRRKTLDDEDWQRYLHAEDTLKALPIRIYDSDVETVARIRTRARRWRPDLLVVDYVQLVQARAQNREAEVASISRGLKAIAHDDGIPVLAPVQLNRDSEKREAKRPTLADLRDSGSLEQDADVVYLLHRGEAPNRVDFTLAKFRYGPTQGDAVGWDSRVTKFYDL